ncbi:MAG: VOC family protein [Pseudomonadota bacterium]
MLKLDHITVIAPTLAERATHVQDCLDIEVPFGTRHHYMGTHNHRLQLGNSAYLEIVALDPDGFCPQPGMSVRSRKPKTGQIDLG